MKEQHWDDSTDDSPIDILEASTMLQDESDDEPVERSSAAINKLKVTEMRRKIEERMDSKRLSLEFDYDEFENWTNSQDDNWADNLQ